MSAGWVAATVRARAARSRRLGRSGARSLAGCRSLDEALDRLASSPYGHDVGPGQGLTRAQHAVAQTLLWNLRVLAGWMPREGAGMLRVLAGWAEIANTDVLMASLVGDTGPDLPPAFELGSLSTAWPRLATVPDLTHLRAELAASAWGDPGADDVAGIQLGMRVSWAARVTALCPTTRTWATGAVALLVAHELLRDGAMPAAAPGTGRVLGPQAMQSGGVDELARVLPTPARQLLESGRAASELTLADLWRAEASWWRRVDDDSSALGRSPEYGLEPVLATVGLLAVDAWRVRAALELAARGGTPLDAFDAVA
ncbi:V-type ATPase subunit [Oryzihumus sp.]